MKRLALLRFHAHFDVCRDRVKLFRNLNPGVEIVGLYNDRGLAGVDLDMPVYSVRLAFNQHELWKHGDLLIRDWFIEHGHKLDFDVLHVLEWDLLLLAPLVVIYPQVAVDSIGLTGLRPLSQVPQDWPWMNREPAGSEWRELYANVGGNRPPYACQGTGTWLSRRFLERYAGVEPGRLCHDELRLPLYAQALQISMQDTDIAADWMTPFYNCQKQAIPREVVERELATPTGCRVFHPFYMPVQGLRICNSFSL